MAKSDEHRMLFDLRGRRKRVIQVVYALLAILMAASLFVAVGPFSITDAFNTGGGGGDARDVFADRIERLERKLRRNPDDQTALAQLTIAYYSAGNAGIERDPAGQPTGISEEAVTDFDRAGDTWQRYLKTDPGEPNPTAAQLAAQSMLYAASAGTALEFEDSITVAAEAQQIFAEAEPSVNSYLQLAQFRYFAGDTAGGAEAGRRAVQEAPASQRRQVEALVRQYRQQGEQVQRQVEAASKAQGGAGKQALENPLGGLSGGGAGTGAP